MLSTTQGWNRPCFNLNYLLKPVWTLTVVAVSQPVMTSPHAQFEGTSEGTSNAIGLPGRPESAGAIVETFAC